MNRTMTVKAKDSRAPWPQLLLVAVATWLAAGCSPTAAAESDALILSFDEETAGQTTAQAPVQISRADQNGLALTFIR